ncbi:MAG: Rv3235 family protein [Antricoccus sp.]
MSAVTIAVHRAPTSEPPASTHPIQERTQPLYRRLQVVSEQLMIEGLERSDQLPPAAIPDTQPNDQAIATFASWYCLAVAEVLTGRRGYEQLRANSALGILQWIRQYSVPTGRRRTGAAPRMISVNSCMPAAGTAEVTAIFRVGPSVRAMTARFSHLRGDWRCVHLQVISPGPGRRTVAQQTAR